MIMVMVMVMMLPSPKSVSCFQLNSKQQTKGLVHPPLVVPSKFQILLCTGMGLLLFLTLSLALAKFRLVSSAPLASHSISPNFTASNFQLIDQSGAFLSSLNDNFRASITNANHGSSRFYFLLLHAPSNTVIWSANPNLPVSSSSPLTLSPSGLSLSDDSGSLVWSSPPLSAPVAALQLLDNGNLVLLDHANASLWESFHSPTDTIVLGQRLTVQRSLFAAADGNDLSVGDAEYRLLVTSGDLLLQWNRLTFWKLSMDLKAFRDSYAPVSFMAINASGFYLFGGDGSTVVMHVTLPSSGLFRFGRFGSDGRFRIISFVDGNFVEEFAGPSESCRIPTICGRLKLCSAGTCSCPPSFTGDSHNNDGCVPADSSLSLPAPCTTNNITDRKGGELSNLNSSFSYLRLVAGADYFANNFMDPTAHGVDLQFCKDLCSRNCSCLGIFYEEEESSSSSSSCFLVRNKLGSIMSANRSRVGYIKTLQTNPFSEKENRGHSSRRIPLAGLVLIPSSAIFLAIALGAILLWLRRRKASAALRRSGSCSSTELEATLIPGLPVRYGYEEIAAATENFKTQIGSGGFGTVYKGVLADKSAIAVKRMTSLGAQGKRDFLAEIAVIGNIHHVNLVRLKGFCMQGRQRLLVLEYMNRGSLDEALFGEGPVLEWGERFRIALGTARGLAYLHGGCDHKIIHCDVKPENILLSHNLDLGVKISDFGLSKLLTPEQSGLFTTLRGTRGYLAPEWLTSSAISDKSDVYSFGMVLLEIVRGRKNCSFRSLGEGDDDDGERGYFPLLALEMHREGRYLELADRRLEGRVRSGEVEMLVRVGLCCVHEDPALRPSMANVVGMLEGGVAVADPIVESLNFLHVYGRRFTEASRIGDLASVGRAGHNGNSNSVVTAFSYISSQQVSGPR